MGWDFFPQRSDPYPLPLKKIDTTGAVDLSFLKVSGGVPVWDGSGWTSYVPALTAATTNPTLGSGSNQVGAYKQIGKTVVCKIYVAFGTSGVNAGSGVYFISLPVASNTLISPGVMGGGWMYDSSATTIVLFMAELAAGGTTFQMRIANVTGGQVTNAVPWTWAASDIVANITITYEAA